VQRRDGQVGSLHLPHLRGLEPHVRSARLAILQGEAAGVAAAAAVRQQETCVYDGLHVPPSQL
jgi:hypothetical protein